MSAGRCRECRTEYTLAPSGRHTLVACGHCGYSHLLLEQPTGLTTLPRVVPIAHEEVQVFPAGVHPNCLPDDHPDKLVWKARVAVTKHGVAA